MKVLVTGGAGFIGSHIVERFQGKAEIRVLDNLRTGRLSNLAGMEAEFFQGSVADRNCVRQAMDGIDYVFHLAAMVSVPESMEQPVVCSRINTEGTLNVLEEARLAGVKKLVFSSSAAVYGDDPSLPKEESMAPAPKSPYAITKLDGEYYCNMYCDEGWLKTACLRYFNVCGMRQDDKGMYAAVVPAFIKAAIAGAALVVHGDGGQTRDFIGARAVAEANHHMAFDDSATGVFNLGSGQPLSILDLANKVIRLAGSNSPIEFSEPRAGDIRDSYASIERIRSIGFDPQNDMEQSLWETISFYRKL